MADPVISDAEMSARNWVDSLTARNQWRVQNLSERYRKDPSTGARIAQPLKIRRFAEGCPPSCLKEAIDYLLSQAPYTGIIFNGQTLSGSYLPTVTSWTRDDQTTVSGLRKTDGTYTLVQDLVDSTLADEVEFKSQESCSEEVFSEYSWDSPTVGSFPSSPRGQGHTWAVQAVSRNEDGTFDYCIVHRHALTQHLAAKTVEDSTLRFSSVETWDNVYTGTGGAYVDDAGTALTVPTPGIDGSGNEVKVQVSENPDCTLKIQVTRERVKSVVTRQQSQHTISEGVHEEDQSGASLPLGHAPDATGGVIKLYETVRQADGKFALKRRTQVERSVPASVVEVSVGFKGKRTTTTNVNQPAPASLTDIALGGRVRIEKTPGNLYNNTISVWDRATPLVAGERCEEDLFSHTDSQTRSGIPSIPTDHVTGGTGGVTRTRRTDMDEEGAIIQVTETKTERSVTNAEEEWSVGIDGVTHRVTHRSRSTAESAPSFSLATVGKTVVNRKTPGGLFDVIITSVDKTTASLVVEAACSKTQFEHTDSKSTTDPNGTVSESVHVSDASAGKTYDRQSKLNSNGSVTTTERTVTEVAQTDAQLSYRRTSRGLVTTRTNRNSTTAATDPGASAVGCSRSHEKTPGGRYNFTEVILTQSAVADSARCRKTYYEHEHDNITLGTGSIDTSEPADAANGVHHLKTSELDGDGFVKTVDRVTTELTRANAEKSYRRTARGLVTTTLDRSSTTPAADPGAGNVGNSQSHVMTDGGRYNLTKVTLTPSSSPDSAYCSKDYFEHVHDTVTLGRGSVDSTDVANAGSGVRRTKTSDLDNDGFVKTVLRTTTEIAVSGAEKSYRRTVRGLVTTTTDRNGTVQAADPGANAVGCTQTHRITPGGRYDLTKVVLTASANADSAYHALTKFDTTSDAVTMATGTVDNTAPTRADGTTVVKTSDLDNDGFVKTVVRTTTEHSVSEAEKSYRRTVRGLVTTTMTRNGTTAAADPGANAVGCSQTHRITPGGRYDLTVVTLSASANADSAYHARTKFENVDDAVTMGTGSVDNNAPTRAAGTTVVKTSELDSDGFVKTVVRTTSEQAMSSKRVEYTSDHFSKTKRITDVNQPSATATELSPVAADANQIVTVELDTTPGGYGNKTTTTVTGQYRTWDQTVELQFSYVKKVWFRNATAAQKNSLFSNLQSSFNSLLSTWSSGHHTPSSSGITPDVDLNKYGTFDGCFTATANWHPESSGRNGTVNYVFYYKDYDRKQVTHDVGVVDGTPYVMTKTVTHDVYIECGRGETNFQNLISSGALFGFEYSYDPITERYTVTKTYGQRVEISYEQRQSNSSSYSHTDT